MGKGNDFVLFGNKFYVGGNDPSKIFVGTSEASKIYFGSTLIWEKAHAVTTTTFYIELAPFMPMNALITFPAQSSFPITTDTSQQTTIKIGAPTHFLGSGKWMVFNTYQVGTGINSSQQLSNIINRTYANYNNTDDPNIVIDGNVVKDYLLPPIAQTVYCSFVHNIGDLENTYFTGTKTNRQTTSKPTPIPFCNDINCLGIELPDDADESTLESKYIQVEFKILASAKGIPTEEEILANGTYHCSTVYGGSVSADLGSDGNSRASAKLSIVPAIETMDFLTGEPVHTPMTLGLYVSGTRTVVTYAGLVILSVRIM